MGMRALPNLFRLSFFNWTGSFAPIFLLVIFILFLLIVLTQHQVRHLQTRYAQALQQKVLLEETLGKLTLEKHHLTASARVQAIAQTKLSMQYKTSENSQIILLEKSKNSTMGSEASTPTPVQDLP